jgi:putative FmdB family regulatory protein
MPYYQYKCEICSFNFDEVFSIHEDSKVTLCPECGGISNKQFGAPILRGLNPEHKRFEYNFNRPDPYRECLDAAKKLEESGRMTKADRRNLNIRLDGLKRAEATRVKVDYGEVGHPLERTDD